MEPGELPDSLEFLHSRWFWISAGCIAAACIGLCIAYYLRHPERDLWTDFQRRGLIENHAQTNGHVPGAEARPGVDVVEGAAPQTQD
jgi:hypothetical protein